MDPTFRPALFTETVTYSVHVRQPGTGNKWVEWHKPKPGKEEVLELAGELLDTGFEVKIKRFVTIERKV
jgi:hypothetical protein